MHSLYFSTDHSSFETILDKEKTGLKPLQRQQAIQINRGTKNIYDREALFHSVKCGSTLFSSIIHWRFLQFKYERKKKS